MEGWCRSEDPLESLVDLVLLVGLKFRLAAPYPLRHHG